MDKDIKQIAMGCKPDPQHFHIMSLEHLNGCTIIVANYGGDTFGGNKLMVLDGEYHTSELTVLDPHFLNETYPVFARFQPNEKGMMLARVVASVCKQ